LSYRAKNNIINGGTTNMRYIYGFRANRKKRRANNFTGFL
jgi:hypothetical protein